MNKKNVHCQSCKNNFKVLEKQKGKYTNCIHCGKQIFIFTEELNKLKKDEHTLHDKHPHKKTVNL
ncbi:MAG: hypothetical protein JNM93_12705 [Bacteriovoracaceae bacterium]|nr:hypothetical protein [Bacteriovoracaceae bacterium]